MGCHSLLRHLYVWVLAAVVVHTLVTSMDVHAGLRLSTLMFACFTFIYICRGQFKCVWLNRARIELNKHILTQSRLRHYEGTKSKVLSSRGRGWAYPGTFWCPAAGNLLGTRRRTSLVRWHTGTGTGNWSSCTHQYLSSYKFRFWQS